MMRYDLTCSSTVYQDNIYIYIDGDGDDDRYVLISCMYSIYSFIHSVFFSIISCCVVMITHDESFNAVIYHHNTYLFHHS